MSTQRKVHKKKTVEDYFFYMGSSKKASNDKMVDEFVVNHIKRTFDQVNVVSEAFKTMVKANTDIWKPTLKIISNTDVSIK